MEDAWSRVIRIAGVGSYALLRKRSHQTATQLGSDLINVLGLVAEIFENTANLTLLEVRCLRAGDMRCHSHWPANQHQYTISGCWQVRLQNPRHAAPAMSFATWVLVP